MKKTHVRKQKMMKLGYKETTTFICLLITGYQVFAASPQLYSSFSPKKKESVVANFKFFSHTWVIGGRFSQPSTKDLGRTIYFLC
jgi:hypothetical protein